jgi:beta-lactamase class A
VTNEDRPTLPHLAALDPALDEVPGTVSIWCGRLDGEPAYAREPHATHNAASTMKVAVMVTAYRLADEGELDLDAPVLVHDEFASASGEGTYRSTADYDNDPQPWALIGQTAPLRWLVRRMIVRSSNLATNLVLEQVGLDSVRLTWARAGATHSIVSRGIQDYAAAGAGMRNLVTAADLAGLMCAIGLRKAASKKSCQEMLDILLSQEVTEDIVQGLPPGTAVAHKNGWIEDIRHSAALVLPTDAPTYALVVCVSAPLKSDAACEVVANVGAASWADRHLL